MNQLMSHLLILFSPRLLLEVLTGLVEMWVYFLVLIRMTCYLLVVVERTWWEG